MTKGQSERSTQTFITNQRDARVRTIVRSKSIMRALSRSSAKTSSRATSGASDMRAQEDVVPDVYSTWYVMYAKDRLLDPIVFIESAVGLL
ncbi:hypothetical protein GOBAR_AA26722 [Gossypium barbadense]|uniref:Uncharacterized protein n=1 Tax=Gossypium barbadense TaxID=3634 RepID=A0A2P5WS83_GOSBA|nr:hypothetical protein GOBAR_AA26722 [Gossypium barbadense]